MIVYPVRAISFDINGTLIHSPRLGEVYAEILGRHGIDKCHWIEFVIYGIDIHVVDIKQHVAPGALADLCDKFRLGYR